MIRPLQETIDRKLSTSGVDAQRAVRGTHPLKNTFSFSAFSAQLITLSEHERGGMFTISSSDHAKILTQSVEKQTHS